jgi:hypothetical protein
MRLLFAQELLRYFYPIRNYNMQHASQKIRPKQQSQTQQMAKWVFHIQNQLFAVQCARRCCVVRTIMHDQDAPETAVHFTPQYGMTCSDHCRVSADSNVQFAPEFVCGAYTRVATRETRRFTSSRSLRLPTRLGSPGYIWACDYRP